MRKKRLFYVSHPYGGKPENERAVQAIIDEISGRKLRPNSLIFFVPFGADSKFVSPIHILGPLYDAIPYIDGLDLCLSLLRRCDGIIMCGDWQHSRGCMAEYGYAKASGIPVFFFPREA